MRPSITVVVPTRERADTLKHTIRTCLEQDYAHLRVLICDNHSSDNTRDVVASFEDDRLSYLRTERRLDMADNWEFALNHVNSDFVTYLGDDDGLLTGGVALAANLLSRYDTQILTWRKAEYHWPDHIVEVYRNYLEIPLSSEIELKKCKVELARLRRFLISYSSLPCIYNSFVSTGLLRQIQQRSRGRFFCYSAPDVYSAIVLALHAESYVWTKFPLTLNGASRHSTGTASMHGLSSASPVRSFVEEAANSSTEVRPSFAPSVDISVAEALDAAMKAFPDKKDQLAYDLRDLIQNAYIRASTRPHEIYEGVVRELRRRASSANLVAFLKDLELRNKNYPLPISVKYGFSPQNNTLTVNAGSLGLHNVFDASLFVSGVLSQVYELNMNAGAEKSRNPGAIAYLRSVLASALRTMKKEANDRVG